MKTKFFTILLLFLFSFRADGQHKDSALFFAQSPSYNSTRFKIVLATEATLYVGIIYALGTVWYADYPHSAFHSFNDNDEWLQMDKAGHIVAAYYLGRTGINLLRWSGAERKKIIWYGGGVGFLYQSTIEILDGFSRDWGFSWGDFTANALGSAMVIGQELAWDEQRVSLKYSFHKTIYPQYRPNLLGNNLGAQMVKDYNGATCWMSVNISSFLAKENKFPKWLNIAVGYGAEGMTGAVYNPPFDKNGEYLPTFDRYRKFYLSLDADLTRIKTKSHFLKTVFNIVGFIKVPAPTIEFSEKGMKAWGIYF